MIGSNMIDALLAEGDAAICFDNFSTGQERFLQRAGPGSGIRMVRGDLLETGRLEEAMKGSDIVFHFAANADVRHGAEHPGKDLEQNTVATFNVLNAMLKNGIKKIVFSSTGSIYGESQVIPTPEDAPFPIQTSLYGASKLACEGLISAFCEAFGMNAWIFRFVSILGERYSHGHIFDFCKQLFADSGNSVSSGMETRENPTCTSRTALTRSCAPFVMPRARSTFSTLEPTSSSL